jgi:uncharacterized protein involved in outer membrane biogenesis
MRFVAIALTVFILLVAGALIGPSFVDWNKYKPQIIAQIDKATGLKVAIDGDIALGILPSPHVKINDLTVAAPRKVNFENLLEMKEAEVSVAMVPLFSKKIVVDTVTLISPVINIEALSDGTQSWQTEKLSAAQKVKENIEVAVEQNTQQPQTPTANAMDSVSLNALKIEDGIFNYVDHKGDKTYALSDVNIDLQADSLKGPFDIQGALVYDGKKIDLDVETGRLPEKGGELELRADIGLPDADAKLSYGGVVTMAAPYEVQGQVNADISSLKKAAALFGAEAADQSLKLDGLLTASQNKIDYNNLKISLGDFVGNGKISVQNLQSKNPLIVNANVKSTNVLNLEPFMKGEQKTASASSEAALKNTGKGAAQSEKGLLPNSLTLPMAIKADVRLDVGGVKAQGKTVKGLFVDFSKDKSKITANFKALELPGQGKVDGVLKINYASVSESPKTGQVIYIDPTATYKVNGQIGQLETFLKTFAPKVDTKAVTRLYKTAQFNLDGRVSNNAVSLKDSVVKLDDFVIGLGGRYEPAKSGGRAKAIIDMSAGMVDLDKINAAQGKKSAVSNDGESSSSSAKSSPKEAVKPLQNLSLPMDLGFDVSVQKLRVNGADIEGVRLTGDLTGNKLTLKNASTNSYAGAAMSIKGVVGNLKELSGFDLNAAVKTQDVKKLARAFKVDTSKLPASLEALDANVTGKGSVETLNFAVNLKSMGGQLDATGNAANILETPSFDNLAIRLKHPNLVRAIQIAAPDFKGATGLDQPIDFYTKASTKGKVYTLTDMKSSLGGTDFGGNLTIDTGVKPMSVRGSIKAGRIALDQLTGGEASSGGSGSGTSSGGSSSQKSSGGRFSKSPINLDWMKTLDVDVDLAASSIVHGKWLLTSPSTDLKIAKGQLTVDDMKAEVFGGQANVSTIVKAEPVSMTMKSTMTNINLEKLVGALTGGNKLKSSGTVSFMADVSGAGNSAHALVNGMNGTAALDGSNVALQGFDLAKLARGLAVEEKLATSVTSLIDGATRGGETKFDTVKGNYKITNGVANVVTMTMDGSSAVIKTTGYADFPKWFVNLDNEIALKNVADLDPFTVKIKGPLDNPSDTFGKNILEDYLGDKLKRKLAKELPDVLGDDVTEKLQQFGILPQQRQQAPVPTPSNDNQPPVEESPAQETPAEQQPQQQSDPLQRILEDPNNAEDAVNDLIKGLF